MLEIVESVGDSGGWGAGVLLFEATATEDLHCDAAPYDFPLNDDFPLNLEGTMIPSP